LISPPPPQSPMTTLMTAIFIPLSGRGMIFSPTFYLTELSFFFSSRSFSVISSSQNRFRDRPREQPLSRIFTIGCILSHRVMAPPPMIRPTFQGKNETNDVGRPFPPPGRKPSPAFRGCRLVSRFVAHHRLSTDSPPNPYPMVSVPFFFPIPQYKPPRFHIFFGPLGPPQARFTTDVSPCLLLVRGTTIFC